MQNSRTLRYLYIAYNGKRSQDFTVAHAIDFIGEPYLWFKWLYYRLSLKNIITRYLKAFPVVCCSSGDKLISPNNYAILRAYTVKTDL